MNWTKYEVTDKALKTLIDYNEPITIPNGVLEYNVGVEVYSLTNNKLNAIYDAKLGAIRKLNTFNPEYKNLKNRDLMLYNDFLLNDSINTVIIDGFFGTGKTSTVCSHLVSGLVKGTIKKAFLSKPHVSLGHEYGFLPGDLHDKTAPEFKSFTQYFDRFGEPGLADALMGIDQDFRKISFDGKPQGKVLEIVVFQYLRGIDIDLENSWVVLDESQNTTVKEMTSFISRVGDKAKLIIMGDSTVTQIDLKGNTAENNGLVFAKEVFRNTKYSGYVELQTINHILRGQRVRDLFSRLK